MGTDIHLAAEARNDEGEWEFVPGPIIECWACSGTGRKRVYDRDAGTYSFTNDPCMWCTNDGRGEPGLSDASYYRRIYVEPGKTRDTWFSERSYVTFAILGNVRNGHGFAGVETHAPLPYISSDRGIPDDVTPETLDVLSGEHSATWVTMAEIIDYDWKQQIHQSGVITLRAYAALRGTGAAPRNWSGGIDGPNIATVTTQQADAILARHPLPLVAVPSEPNPFLDDGDPIDGIRYYVRYRWTEPLERYTEMFLQRMRELASVVGEHECRLVMDFDS
jgi:hypothetical protein